MSLVRPGAGRGRVTLVPLIDVLFILLVYFMVTSVYLDLDMIPVARKADLPATATAAAADPAENGPQGTAEAPRVLLRIDAGGQALLRGARADAATLAALATENPPPQVLILPSGAAPLHALTDLLDALARAGLQDTRLVRIEAQP